jgi:hypothetical protein
LASIKAPSTKAGIAGMIAGAVVRLTLMVFVHVAEAKAFGIFRGILGKSSLPDAPGAIIGPPVIALPLTFIVMIVIQYT